MEWRSLPARPARCEPFPAGLHPILAEALQTQGVQALYTHQSQAWQHVQNSRHIVVVTGTASGKTLCYNLPVLDCLLRDEGARALFLFPTKALTQDQLSGLKVFMGHPKQGNVSAPIHYPLSPAVYDGDTPSYLRPSIRANTRLLLTNPDMLHTGILPHHTQWAEFFRGLRFVVLDELHTYRGVFGSHVANVLRRLKRVALHYGAHPHFVLTSATIANPQELAEWLVEETVTVVDDAPVGTGVTPTTITVSTPTVITLNYTDVELDEATNCSVTNLSVNLSITAGCACLLGTCTVGIQSSATGSESFDYTVTANGSTSAPVTANLTVTP